MKTSVRRASGMVAVLIAAALFFTALGFFLATGVDRPVSTRAEDIWTEGQADEVSLSAGPDFGPIAEEMKPSVVHVVAIGKTSVGESPGGEEGESPDDGLPEEHPPLPPDFENAADGSGVIIGSDGYILTNRHVIEGADEVMVIHLGEDRYEAEVIGSDGRDDIALLKIDPGDEEFPVAPLGDSEVADPGEWVMAMGNPLGFEYSVTVGVISGKGRSLPQSQFMDFLQTDAAIYPGNSGGPLFNLAGEVIGINTAVIPDTNLGFAVPINTVKEILPELLEHGSVTRGYLGVTIQTVGTLIDPPEGTEEGAGVVEVHPGTPAEDAGVLANDVIVSFDGQEVRSTEDLTEAVTATDPGSRVQMTVVRNGEEQTLEVVVGSLPAELE